MKERIMAADPGAKNVWVSTFHRMGVKLLRSYGDKVGLRDGFSIYDDDDCKGLMQKVHRMWAAEQENEDLKLGPKERSVLMSVAGDLRESAKPFDLENVDPRIGMYIRELHDANAVDFSGMLYLTWKILTKFPEIANKLSARFKFVMVDEAQDTNDIQYAIAKILASHGNLFMVADYNQSIFSWRGAKPENLSTFKKDYPDALVLSLPRNYRSCSEILDKASNIIHCNPNNETVELISARGEGGAVEIHQYENEWEEANQIAHQMHCYHDQGYKWEDMAVIYRLNKQSQAFEMALSQNGIPFKTKGGPSFFARKEIKTTLAYMKLLTNPSDSAAFAQAISYPKRGVGDVLIGKIDILAKKDGISVMEAASKIKTGRQSTRALLDDFATLLDRKREEMRNGRSLMTVVDELVKESGYMGQLKNEADEEKDGPRSIQRLENLETFVIGIGEFEDANTKPSLEKFLQQIALVQEGDSRVDDSVSMMSMHSAKGLEFPVVFIVGAAAGVMPFELAVDEGRGDEERRLFYVAVTRAKDQLHVSYPEQVRKWSSTKEQDPSPYLFEMFGRDLKEEK
jgi:DNA helicase-2/ATP-dependent DNA helicase PcrA